MNQSSVTLTVFFEDPFWVGVIERFADGELSVCKIVYGAEPKDAEILHQLLCHYQQLRFSLAVPAAGRRSSAKNPKRAQRQAQRQIHNKGIGTRSQQALKQLQEIQKKERTIRSRAQAEADQRYKMEVKRQKKKARHKGR